LFEAYARDGAAVSALMAALKAEGGFSLSQGVLETLQRDFQSGRCGEEQTRAQIGQTWKDSGELLCPHSAIGVHVAEQQIQPETQMITLATAHPAKFPDAVESATGLRPDLPPHMADLFERPERIARVANDLGALKQFIKERISI
jgi:threonine synthase